MNGWMEDEYRIEGVDGWVDILLSPYLFGAAWIGVRLALGGLLQLQLSSGLCSPSKAFP